MDNSKSSTPTPQPINSNQLNLNQTNNFNLYSQSQINVEIPKLKEGSSSFLNFFSGNKKQDIVDFAIYKSEAIIGFKDSSIILYDMIREYQKLNFDVLINKKLKLIQFEILHRDNDVLLCLCEYSLVIIDIENFTIISKTELFSEALKFYTDYLIEDNGDKVVRILVLGKNYINIFMLNFTEISKQNNILLSNSI